MKSYNKEVRARLKGSEVRNGIIKRFVLMDELPKTGDPVPNTRCVYGEAIPAVLSGWQHTRDQDTHYLYDFYVVPVLNDGFAQVGDAYICTLHRSKKEITPKIYTGMIKIAEASDSLEDFLVEAKASKLWDEEDVDRNGRDEWLVQLYVAVKRTVTDIIKEAKLTQLKLVAYFGIPRRTVEGWIYDNKPPLYTIMMMQEILGLVKRK